MEVDIEKCVVGGAGFEPTTFGFGGQHSIHLSYPPTQTNLLTGLFSTDNVFRKALYAGRRQILTICLVVSVTLASWAIR